MDMRLSNEDIALLAENERRMDSGEQPFCRLDGQRVAVMPEVMTELGLEAGQTISGPIFTRILECQLAVVQAKLVIQKSTDEITNGQDGSSMQIECEPGIWPKWDVWVNGILVYTGRKVQALELANRLRKAIRNTED